MLNLLRRHDFPPLYHNYELQTTQLVLPWYSSSHLVQHLIQYSENVKQDSKELGKFNREIINIFIQIVVNVIPDAVVSKL